MTHFRSMKIALRILINTLVGIILIFVWSRFVNLNQLLGMLAKADVKIALAFFVFFLTSSFLRAWRLKILLQKFKLSLKNVIALNLLSQFLSFTIPIRAGEVAKSVYLSTEYKMPLGKTIIWILLDRFLDFWVALLLINISLLFIPTNLPSKIRLAILIVLLGFSLATLLLIISQKYFLKLVALFSRLLIFPKLQSSVIKLVTEIVDSFSILRRQPSELVQLLGLTIIAYLSDGMIWLIIALSLGIKLGFFQFFLGNLLSALTFLIPAAPGYVGSAEASGLAIFSGVLGLSPNQASAMTLLNHIFTIVAMPIFGVSAIYFLKFDLSRVMKKIFKKT